MGGIFLRNETPQIDLETPNPVSDILNPQIFLLYVFSSAELA